MELRVAMPEEPSVVVGSAQGDVTPLQVVGDQTPKPARKRIVAYDMLRVFAALTVVSIHVYAPYMKTNGPFEPASPFSLFSWGLHYAVPMFTFLAGVLSWGVVWSGGRGAYSNFLRRRLLIVGVPYLVWCAIFYFLRPFADQGQIPGNVFAMAWQFIELVISGKMWYHLYFVPMILVLYLLTPIASRAVRKSPELFLVVGLAGIVYGGGWLVDMTAFIPFGRRTMLRIVVPVLVSLVAYGPFMVLGAWFGVRRAALERALRWAAVPLLAAAVAVLVYTQTHPALPGPLREVTWLYVLDMSLFVLGFLGVAFVAADTRPFAEGSALAKRTIALAAGTLGVYLMHPLVVTFGERKLVEAMGFGWTWHYLGFAVMYDVLAIVVCFAVVMTFKRFRLTSHLA
jgi:surface polysaccharide O-acyltransferase-like enzyme